jgi:hypothetical protein
MLFRLVNAEYDPDAQRAYVKFRAKDLDGGEIKARLSKPQIRTEIVS